MKRALSPASFEYCQASNHSNTAPIQSVFQPRVSAADTTHQETFGESGDNAYSHSGNCCGSHQEEQESWHDRYSDNFGYNQQHNVGFTSWDHYCPEYSLNSYAYESAYTRDISLSDISPAPVTSGYKYDLDHEMKWSRTTESLYQGYDEPVAEAYEDIYKTNGNDRVHEVHSISPSSPPKRIEEDEYKDDDYEDDDEQMFTIKSRKKKIKSSLGNPRPKHVGKACTHCKKAHLACDTQRPCKRCVRLGKDDCVDVEHKRRGRPRSSLNHRKTFRTKGISIPNFDTELLGFVPAAAE